MNQVFRVISLSVCALLLAWIPACKGSSPVDPAGSGPGAAVGDEMTVLMGDHYPSVLAAHTALIVGDLRGMGQHLGELEGRPLPEGAPESWQPLYDNLLEAARNAAGAGA